MIQIFNIMIRVVFVYVFYMLEKLTKTKNSLYQKYILVLIYTLEKIWQFY